MKITCVEWHLNSNLISTTIHQNSSQFITILYTTLYFLFSVFFIAKLNEMKQNETKQKQNQNHTTNSNKRAIQNHYECHVKSCHAKRHDIKNMFVTTCTAITPITMIMWCFFYYSLFYYSYLFCGKDWHVAFTNGMDMITWYFFRSKRMYFMNFQKILFCVYYIVFERVCI